MDIDAKINEESNKAARAIFGPEVKQLQVDSIARAVKYLYYERVRDIERKFSHTNNALKQSCKIHADYKKQQAQEYKSMRDCLLFEKEQLVEEVVDKEEIIKSLQERLDQYEPAIICTIAGVNIEHMSHDELIANVKLVARDDASRIQVRNIQKES